MNSSHVERPDPTVDDGSEVRTNAQAVHRDDFRNFARDLPKAHLIDPYDVYQHLMTYWSETMQDDVYMLTTGSWIDAAKVQQILDKEDKSKADLTHREEEVSDRAHPSQLIIAQLFCP